ncbi:S8 family serine peptidase [Pinibacter soli]|uniref:S8 family serine peptidase n=1 Tax=Pinibacter soli TaxID=3044211 RepID=A0ABT6R8T2_9BACT|nr:S8 family serine peptidase [Pinibacter soli]MDI3318968.1 S8 family serine peptidase [Pinibacter soli]
MKQVFSFFILAFAMLQAHSQTRVGLWEPYFNGNIQASVFFNGTVLEKNTHAADEHGMAVVYTLTKGMNKYSLYHAGFTPLTAQLKQAGILNMTVAQRKEHLNEEYRYYKTFALETVKWFRKQKVKVVNMSFGTSASIFAENNLNLGNTPEERFLAAKQWMQEFKKSFERAFASAPEILFVVAAGNDEEDMEESFDVPGLAKLPNVLCVGALSKDGKRIISNRGKAVDIYVPAEDVEWIDSNGDKHIDTGTSLAVPVVVKQAVTLLQKDSKLISEAIKKKLIEANTHSQPMP